MSAFYLALSIIGIVVPYGFFVRLMEHGRLEPKRH